MLGAAMDAAETELEARSPSLAVESRG
jgi:hypothetical protein